MRVERDFEPEIAQRLAFVEEEALKKALDQIPKNTRELAHEAWMEKELEKGLADLEAGRTVPHEEVVAWVRSWGTDNECPKPTCQ